MANHNTTDVMMTACDLVRALCRCSHNTRGSSPGDQPPVAHTDVSARRAMFRCEGVVRALIDLAVGPRDVALKKQSLFVLVELSIGVNPDRICPSLDTVITTVMDFVAAAVTPLEAEYLMQAKRAVQLYRSQQAHVHRQTKPQKRKQTSMAGLKGSWTLRPPSNPPLDLYHTISYQQRSSSIVMSKEAQQHQSKSGCVSYHTIHTAPANPIVHGFQHDISNTYVCV